MAGVFPARANIYATNIRLNGKTNNVVRLPGQSVTIGFILNDYANAGTQVSILSGTNLVRRYEFSNGEEGTWRRTNQIHWDGCDQLGHPVAPGTYSVQITTACDGYPGWAPISEDPLSDVFEPRGIAVNCNSNSPYYGRVYVGNAPFYGGEDTGIFKFNADGTPAEEGFFSNGGYAWAGGRYSPWKMQVAKDDRLYVGDFREPERGLVVSFDPVISTESFRAVLRVDNYTVPTVLTDGPYFSGPLVTGTGTNMQLWMADVTALNIGQNFGITRWDVGPGGVIASNDPGTMIVATGGGSDLNVAPYDMDVDPLGHIYTIQRIEAPESLSYRVFRFPAYETGPALQVADWKVGSGDETLANAVGVAVDPTGNYVAVALRGAYPPQFVNGGLAIFHTGTGQLLTNIPSAFNDDHTDVTWDNVGNLYALDLSRHVWRAFSPPGSNQTTTVALPIIEIVAQINPPQWSATRDLEGNPQFFLSGQSNVIYIVEASTNLTSWTAVQTNFSTEAVRSLSLPCALDGRFYRAAVAP